MQNWNIVSSQTISPFERLDPEFFDLEYEVIENKVLELAFERIGSLTDNIFRGIQPKYDENGDIPVLRSVNIRLEGINDTRREFVTKEFAESNQRGLSQKGDILITSTGIGTLGRCTYNFSDSPFFVDGHITVLRDIQRIHPLYLNSFLQSKVGKKIIERRKRGSSGQIELYIGDIASIPIPILSEEIQKTVVNYQNEAEMLKRKAKSLYKEAETKLVDLIGINYSRDNKDNEHCINIVSSKDVFSESRLDADFFQLEFINLEKVLKYKNSKRLGELISPIINGYDYRIYKNKGTPYIRVGDIFQGKIDEDGAEKIHLTIDDITKNVDLKVGDILFTRKGSFGNAAVVRTNQTNFIISSEIMRLRLITDEIYPDYLALFINSDFGFTQINRRVHGVGYFSISQPDLERIWIPIIDKSDQLQLTKLIQNSIRAEYESKILLRKAASIIENEILQDK